MAEPMGGHQHQLSRPPAHWELTPQNLTYFYFLISSFGTFKKKVFTFTPTVYSLSHLITNLLPEDTMMSHSIQKECFVTPDGVCRSVCQCLFEILSFK